MNLEHMGLRWGYVFLRTAAYMRNEDLEELMVQAVEMYLAGEDSREIKQPAYEGRLYTERKHELLGGFGGQRFDADLETVRGKDNATFLVNEQTGGGSGFSKN
mgnify:FL=1